MANIKYLGEIQIKSKITGTWIETKDAFIADNLQIYFRSDFGQWRLIDTTNNSGMDITEIKIPLDDDEVLRIKRLCSAYHKTN